MQAAAGERHLSHVPALDGLRGVAVGLVLFHHLGGSRLGGWVGVDVFFVLSGFLITRALLDPARAPMARFWWRRVRRVLPALAVLLAGYLWYFQGVLGVGHPLTRGDVAWLPALNLRSGFDQPWSDRLGHLWSIAAEAQFYVVWPVVLLALVGLGVRHRGLLTLLVGVTLASAGWRLILSLDGTVEWHRLHFPIDVRADALAVGGIVAVLAVTGHLRRAAGALGGLAVPAALVLATFVARADVTTTLPYRGGLLAAVVATGVMVAAEASGRPTVLTPLLASGPLRLLGRLSYSLYLWHLPIRGAVFDIAPDLPTPVSYGLVVTTSLAAAAVSYAAIERPFMTGQIGRWLRHVDEQLMVAASRPQAAPAGAASVTTVVLPFTITLVLSLGVAAAVVIPAGVGG